MAPKVRAKSSRKRQTRLAFDPVNQSSSPSSMSPAKVRYQLDGTTRTPASTRPDSADVFESDDVLSSSKKDDFTPVQKKTGKIPFKPLSTPAKSSQVAAAVGDDSDTLDEQDPIPSTSTRQTRSAAKFMPQIKSKNKQPMGFDGTYDSDEYDLVPKITPKKSSAKKKNTIVNLISDTDDGPAITTPSKASTKKSTSKRTSATPTRASRSASKGMAKRKTATLSDSDDSEDDEELVPLVKLGSSRKNKSQNSTPVLPRLRTYGKKPVRKNNTDSDDDPIVSSPKRSQKPAYKLKQPPTIDDDENKEDEDDNIKSSPVKRRTRQPFVRDEDEEDDEEDEPRILSPLKRARPTVEASSSDVDESPTKRRRRGTQQVVDSDDEPTTPARGSLSRGSRGRQLSIGRRSLSRGTQSQHSSPARATRLQKGKKKHRTAREKQMEILRRRKNGDSSELTESESDSESDSDEFQKLEEFDDEEEEDELPARKTAKAQRKSATPGGSQDNLDEFVVDDDEDDIGVPDEALMGIPLEFTHHAHKKLAEHFKDAVEWMVHNKINPGFARDDPIYKQAFRKLDDEASGLAKSKFTSTQWTQEFTKAVYARPVLEMLPLQAGEGFDAASGLAKCFACNHRGHNSSIALCLTGKAYDRTTLEDIDQGSDDSDKSSKDSDAEDSSDDEDESKSVNSQGASIPPVTKRFPAGSVCRKNTEYAHQLIHWKYNLNQWVISALEIQGELTPEKLVERDAMNSKKRTKYTNAVVDDWADNGQVKELWSDYKRVLETARNLTAQGRGGWK